MENNIDKDISNAEVASLRAHNAALTKQNQLLKREVAQLKDMQTHTQKELAAYKKLILSNSGETQGEVLELQHQRIFDLETQLQVLHGKYTKLVKSAGSQEQTDLLLRCRDLERRLKETELDYQRQLNTLRERLSKQSALQFAQSKRTITSPTQSANYNQLKKSSLAVRKFV